MSRHIALIRRDPLTFLTETWRTYGDVVQFPIPKPPSYLISSPEAVRAVLVTEGRNYTKATLQYRALSLVTGEGLLTAEGESWRVQRPLVQPAFHHSSVERMAAHVVSASDSLITRWAALPDGAVVDVDGEMMRMALEVVGHSLFGSDLSGDADRLAKATLAALDVVVARARVPITPPAWLPTPANRQLARAVSTLDEAVAGLIDRHRDRSDEAGHTPDMLNMLLDARDDEGRELSTSQIRDQMVTFIVAGHETVASALSWAWALLAQHPEFADAIAAEANSVFGEREPCAADYVRLPWTKAVFDETLRLYPPAWLITRTSIDGATLAGREIHPNSLHIISPWIVHRHPDAWRNPGEFTPERFLEKDAPIRSAFFPFGAGLRLCIGRDFAYVEGVLALARIASRLRLSALPGQQLPRAMPLVTIRPEGGLHLRVGKR